MNIELIVRFLKEMNKRDSETWSFASFVLFDDYSGGFKDSDDVEIIDCGGDEESIISAMEDYLDENYPQSNESPANVERLEKRISRLEEHS